MHPTLRPIRRRAHHIFFKALHTQKIGEVFLLVGPRDGQKTIGFVVFLHMQHAVFLAEQPAHGGFSGVGRAVYETAVFKVVL